MPVEAPITETAPAAAPPRVRRPIAAYPLLAAAAALLLVAVVRAMGYPSLASAVDNSGLTPEYRSVVRGLWIGAALQPAIIAGILLVAGLRPGSIAKPALVLVALLPLLSSSVQGAFSGSLSGSILPVLALILTIAAVLLPHDGGSSSRAPTADGD